MLNMKIPSIVRQLVIWDGTWSDSGSETNCGDSLPLHSEDCKVTANRWKRSILKPNESKDANIYSYCRTGRADCSNKMEHGTDWWVLKLPVKGH